MNLASLIDDDLRAKNKLIEENGHLTEELKKLSHNHEELMQVYKGLMEKNEDLSQNHEGIMSEYAQLREEYESLLNENPRKLKQIQEDLIAKYNGLFNEHSILHENHLKLLEDHEHLKKIPIIPRISSTEELDLILDDQLRNSNKMVNQELNSLRTYHQNYMDELVERNESIDPHTSPQEISQDIIKDEEFKKFEDSDLISLTNSMQNSVRSDVKNAKNENNQRKSNDSKKKFASEPRKKDSKLIKSDLVEKSKLMKSDFIEKSDEKKGINGDLGKISRVKIFEPFKIKENEILANSDLGKSLKLEGSQTQIFGPMRNNLLDDNHKNKYKGYSLNNLPDSKKSGLRYSSNIIESKYAPLKLSEFMSLKKSRKPNKLEQAIEIIDQETPMISSNLVQNRNQYINKENRGMEKEKNPKVYYLSDQNFRGKIIEIDHRIFEHAKVAGQSLTKLKIGCLKNKASIFENDLLQIGCIANKEKNEMGKDFLQISLYLTNKSSKKIVEGEICYIGDEGLSLWTKPQVIDSEIKGMGQIRQELILDFMEIPFPLLISEYSWR